MSVFKVFAHVAVLTKDLEESIAFYEKIGGALLKRGQAQKPTGVNHLALVQLGGLTLELIEPGDGSAVPESGGMIPHIAFQVEDVRKAAEELKAKGIDTFQTEKPNELPGLFDGIANWFFKGPSGELIELMQDI